MKKKPGLLTLDHVNNNSIFRDQFHLNYYKDNYPVSTVPHRHNFYEVLWFPEGDGTHCIDDTCFPVTGNDLFLISEGQVHYYKEVRRLEGFMLLFRDVFWEYALESLNKLRTTLFNHLLINAHLKLSLEDAIDISQLFKEILKEYQRPDYPEKAELMIAYLKILLIKISTMQKIAAGAALQSANSDYLLFQRFMELLEQEYNNNHKVNDYAKALHVTSRKLAEISIAFNNRTPKQLIDNRIIIAAKRSLQFDVSAIKEIAFNLNFSDQYHFSKFFKKITGLSPADYRNQFT